MMKWIRALFFLDNFLEKKFEYIHFLRCCEGGWRLQQSLAISKVMSHFAFHQLNFFTNIGARFINKAQFCYRKCNTANHNRFM